MPRGFYRQLPVVGDPPHAGLPRIYLLASELIAASEVHVEPEVVRRFLIAYQATVPLTIGELWALPAMLRLAILRRLGQAVEGLLDLGRFRSGTPREEPGEPLQAELPLIAACILDLRAIDIEDWKTVFEDVSRVEHILRRDPAQVYARMDFETRDRYRKVIERLAQASGVAEEVVAQQAVDLALGDRQRREQGQRPITPVRPRSHLRPASWPLGPLRPPDGRSAPPEAAEAATLFAERTGHVGFYLLDRGLAALEAQLAYLPALRMRLGRWLGEHALWGYLGGIFTLTLLGLAGLAGLTFTLGGTVLQAGVLLLIGLVPAISVAVGLVHAVVPRLVPPHRLLKMEFQDGIPRECTTLVAIPALLTNAEEIRGLLRQLEQHYLSTLDDNLLFALLTDFVDAPSEHMPDDEALLAQVRQGVRQLNQRYAEGHSTPFLLLHRKREWNPSEGVWMGWERKRGKLVELSDWLSGEPGSSYVLAEPSLLLPDVRYVITLDADSLLTRGGARRPDRHAGPPAQPGGLRPEDRRAAGRLHRPAAARARQARQRQPHSADAPVRRRPGAGPVHASRLGRLPGPVPGGHLRRQGHHGRGRLPPQPGRPSPGERPAQPRSVRRDRRPRRAGGGRRGPRELSGSLPGFDRAPASLDARRLAARALAVPPGAGRGRRHDPQRPVDARPLEDPRQPAPQPARPVAAGAAARRLVVVPGTGTAVDGPGRPGARGLDPGRPGARFPPAPGRPVRGSVPSAVDGPGALAADAGAASLRGAAGVGCHRRDACPLAAHAAAAARVDAGGADQPRPWQVQHPGPDLETHGLSAPHGAGGRALARSSAAGIAGLGGADPARLADLAAGCPVAQPSAAPPAARPHARPAPAAGRHRPPYVAVLRALRRAGGPLAAAGPLPGVAARPGGAPYLTHQYRLPIALGAGRQ